MKRRTIIMGGGTIQHYRSHLALCAPAFGGTARALHELIPGSELYLTKMARNQSVSITNEDVEKDLDILIGDPAVGTIILSIAFCDFKPLDLDGIPSGPHAERLKTSEGDQLLLLSPTEKIITKIRKQRPDIFLVGFKTTTGKTSEEQFSIALKMMKSVKCNLVLANDTVTRNNMVITAEETIYGETTDRSKVLAELAEITILRSDLTYTPSVFKDAPSMAIGLLPETFWRTVKFLIDQGGFISNNGNGFTPGHFCWKASDNVFFSSQRKADHNKVFTEGMSKVEVGADGTFTVYGRRKASVGARSQHLIFEANPGYDCIIHTHNPLKEGSNIPIAEQRPFQCGSIECGKNTVEHMGTNNSGSIKAVYLNKHGANILFNSKTTTVDELKNFITENLELGIKVQ